MQLHSRLVGAFDALLLAAAAFTLAALVVALISPPTPAERVAAISTLPAHAAHL